MTEAAARTPGTDYDRATPESSDAGGRVEAIALATREGTAAQLAGEAGARPPSDGIALGGCRRVPAPFYADAKSLTTWEKPDRENRLRFVARNSSEPECSPTGAKWRGSV